MLNIVNQYIEYQGCLHKILRTVKESSKPIIDDWKEHLNADLVLKNEGIFYFVQKMGEAEIIEEDNKA